MNSALANQLTDIVACLYEGSAEKAIIDILLEHHLLIFSEETLLEGRPLRCRDGLEFQSRYLRKNFPCKVSVIRILDSRKEKFKLSREYQDKVSIINIVTAPEIEMLIILNENKYSDFKSKSSRMKPSEYCKSILHLNKIKSYDFVRSYFSDPQTLIQAIRKYKKYQCKRKIQPSEYALYDLVK